MTNATATDSYTFVEEIKQEQAYHGFFKIQKTALRHEKFDGTMTDTLPREVVQRGNSAAVLLFDPENDTVGLIRQFLVGAHFAGRENRPLQIVAGIVEEGESPEDSIRREALEEAGVTLGRTAYGPDFLPSPGGCDELISIYIGQADLPAAGTNTLHGLADEGEDIRLEIYSVEDAFEKVMTGQVETGPALVALLWFMQRHEEISTIWLADPSFEV